MSLIETTWLYWPMRTRWRRIPRQIGHVTSSIGAFIPVALCEEGDLLTVAVDFGQWLVRVQSQWEKISGMTEAVCELFEYKTLDRNHG